MFGVKQIFYAFDFELFSLLTELLYEESRTLTFVQC